MIYGQLVFEPDDIGRLPDDALWCVHWRKDPEFWMCKDMAHAGHWYYSDIPGEKIILLDKRTAVTAALRFDGQLMHYPQVLRSLGRAKRPIARNVWKAMLDSWRILLNTY